MKPFGLHSLSYQHGYDVPLCLSHLQALLDYEVAAVHHQGGNKKVMKRIALVEEALALLTAAAALGEES